MTYLFNEIPKLARIFSSNQKVFLLFNYDGLFFRDVGNYSSNYERFIKQICWISSLRNLYVGTISVRSVDILREEVGTSTIVLAGNLGYEIEGANFKWKFPEIGLLHHHVAELYEKLRWGLGYVEVEKMVENFGLLLRINFDFIEESRHNKILSIIENYLDLNTILEASWGSNFVEVRPRGKWDKGDAVEKIMNFLPQSNAPFPMLMYFGNQSNDEPAFKKANIYGDSVIISEELKKPTSAKFFLKGNSDLLKFLLWVQSCY